MALFKINPAKAVIITALGFLSAVTAVSAQAETTGYNQITFETTASQQVGNDEVTATLYKKAQAVDPAQLASQLNRTMNQALQIAGQYPTVTTNTGSQNTYPQYDDDNHIIGWTGSAAIELKSNDFAATSELVAKLQEIMLIQDMRFGVSQQKQDTVEAALLRQASKDFQTQANTLASLWHATGYRVVSVNLNNRSNYGYYPMASSAAPMMAKGAVAPQQLEGGDSEMTVTVSGTIELVP